MTKPFFLFILLAFSTNSVSAQKPTAGNEYDWFFHYDKVLVLEAKKKHTKAYKSLHKAAELAIETFNEKKMLERLMADQDGPFKYLAYGPKSHDWAHIRKALETSDVKYLKEDESCNPSDEHSGHQH